jgi:hypothetical protein
METTTRNAELGDLVTMLRDQQARKVDVVAPATTLRSVDGIIRSTGTDPVISDDGVTQGDGYYRPTAVCDEGLADKLGVPVAYLKRLRAERPDLYDANVNGWLHGRRPLVRPDAVGSGQVIREAVPADPRSFLVRCFRSDDGQGLARAFLSDRYAVVDNLDVLTAALDGIRDAGVEVNIDGGDLTERRMSVRVTCPAVSVLAPTLLRGYRSPFNGRSGDECPVMWAGFVLTNSEVGAGAYTITPRAVVEVCNNGMTINADALSRVHLGTRLDTGVVRWAEDTQRKALELVKAQTRDAVTTFLSEDYLTDAVARLEARADETVETPEQVRTLVKALRYTDADLDGILGHFIRGGQTTRGGVVNAITAYAQDVTDGDLAHDLEARATSLLLT